MTGFRAGGISANSKLVYSNEEICYLMFAVLLVGTLGRKSSNAMMAMASRGK
jgi:hypothetical protein